LPFFNDLFTLSEARSGGHMLAYFIPGSDGAVAAGSRCLNWVWYVHVGLADLTNVLTDKNGARHRSSLLPGTTPETAVADLRARALRTASRSAIAGRVKEAPISPISWRPVRTDRRENR
jgi:hypothetical protein